MKEVIRMIVVLTLICTVCGVALSAIRDMTELRIELQVLNYVQGPKVKIVLKGSDNDLVADRRKIKFNDEEILLFVGKKEGTPWAIAYETMGTGFGGDLKVMAGYDLDNDKLTGIQIISHKETPGIGARVTEDQYTEKFNGLGINIKFQTKKDGGDIDAVSGATYSSRGVAEALRKSIKIYPEIKKLALSP